MEKLSDNIAPTSLPTAGDESRVVYDARDEDNIYQTAAYGMPCLEGKMQSDLKRAIAWGAGLGFGFAIAGMALGIFRRIR